MFRTASATGITCVALTLGSAFSVYAQEISINPDGSSEGFKGPSYSP
jgi:hypothetical protein